MKNTIKIALFSVFLTITFASSAFAAGNMEIAIRKAALEGLWKCYTKGHMVDQEFVITDYHSYHYDTTNKLTIVKSSGNNYSIPLPTGLYDNDTINCVDVFVGDTSDSLISFGNNNLFKGLTGLYGVSVPSSGASESAYNNVKNFLTSVGYGYRENEEVAKRGGYCFSAPYRSEFPADIPPGTGEIPVLDNAIYTRYACIDTEEQSDGTHMILDGHQSWRMRDAPNGQGAEVIDMENVSNSGGFSDSLSIWSKRCLFSGSVLCDSYIFTLSYPELDDYPSSFYTVESTTDSIYGGAIGVGADQASWATLGEWMKMGPPDWWQKHIDYEDEVTITRLFKLAGSSPHENEATMALKYMSANSYTKYDDPNTTTSLRFSNDEVFQLYTYYFTNYYNSGSAKISCGAESSTEISYYDGLVTNGSYVKFTIKTLDYPEGKACYAPKATQNTGKKVNGVDANMHFGKAISFDELFSTLDGMTIESELPEEFSGVDYQGDPVDGGTPEEQKPECTNNAGALGWIICPIITSASDALQTVYEDLIVPFLMIDTDLLKTQDSSGNPSGVYNVWNTFQTIANLAFVVLFLFVIFSQLTGFGIDNYGIKKILPKLIIGAVLINLSYVICQLAVDIANIVGVGVGNLFKSVIKDSDITNVTITLGPGTEKLNTWWAEGLVVVGLIGVMGAGIYLAGGLAIIVPILLAIIALLVGVFFTFAMLTIRQAVAVILVVVSPLAFVCYILPNTKKIFDQWLNMFKGLLMAFPIMSALVYGGDMVSKILLKANADSGGGVIQSLGIIISAAIVSVAPIFFLPSIIKKSLNAINGLGNIVAKGQGRTGSFLRNPAERRLNNSWLTNGKRRREENRDQREKARNQRRLMRQAGLRYDDNGMPEVTARGERMARRAQRMTGARGEAARAALAARRNQAISGVSADMNTARILSAGGVAATLAGMTNKQQQQEIQDEITNMAGATGNYDLNSMEAILVQLASQDPKDLTADQQLRMKALVTKMSETGFGAKSVASILSGNYKDAAGNRVQVHQNARSQLAGYMTSTDVANKIGNKDMYVAQYLRDIAANTAMTDATGAQTTAGNLDFDSWAMAQRSDGKGGSITNVEHVAKNILDDDELLAKQATASLERTMAVDEDRNGAVGNGEGSYIDSGGNRHTFIIHKTGVDAISHNRAQKIINNENIHTKEEQDKILGRR